MSDTVISDAVLLTQKQAAKYLGVSPSYLRRRVNIRPRELPGDGPKGKPLLRYHRDDLNAQIARWNEEQRGGRKKA
jgi:hypothetical protein